MGLREDDELPEGISMRGAYSAVRTWYQENLKAYDADRQGSTGFWEGSREYIEALPEPQEATEDQILECLSEVIAGSLEFSYHESDGKFKMAAYATVFFDECYEWKRNKEVS